jgi:hypothetical protein
MEPEISLPHSQRACHLSLSCARSIQSRLIKISYYIRFQDNYGSHLVSCTVGGSRQYPYALVTCQAGCRGQLAKGKTTGLLPVQATGFSTTHRSKYEAFRAVTEWPVYCTVFSKRMLSGRVVATRLSSRNIEHAHPSRSRQESSQVHIILMCIYIFPDTLYIMYIHIFSQISLLLTFISPQEYITVLM